MSLTLDSQTAAPVAEPERSRGRYRAGIWVRVGLAVALVGASGALRFWQQSQVNAELRTGRVSPFPLEELPMTLGPWEGEADTLDPTIARATGAVDHISRTYVDRRTGVRLSVIVLYGPADQVYVHSPENCYPVAGYHQFGKTRVREVELAGEESRSLPFKSMVYAKGEGGQAEWQQVVYSWWYNGQWNPFMVQHKDIERIPGMYKVHVARPISEREYVDGDGPCQDFLSLLMPELERRRLAATGHDG